MSIRKLRSNTEPQTFLSPFSPCLFITTNLYSAVTKARSESSQLASKAFSKEHFTQIEQNVMRKAINWVL